MLEPWPWYIAGAALASIPIAHWLLLNRSLAVSGRFTALVNRLRHGKQPAVDLSRSEMVEAVQAATLAAFGAQALEPPEQGSIQPEPARQSSLSHVLFFLGMAAGGFLSALLAGALHPTLGLRGTQFSHLFGDSHWTMAIVLLVGGTLVGFGTRMAAGCTTGHGLCGVSRLQKGSLAATGAFFGMAVAVAWLLRGLA